MANKAFNPFAMAQAQFDEIAEILELDSGTRELLRNPVREYSFSIPVRMDDGSIKIFRGFRVQHNDARGPSKGGIKSVEIFGELCFDFRFADIVHFFFHCSPPDGDPRAETPSTLRHRSK